MQPRKKTYNDSASFAFEVWMAKIQNLAVEYQNASPFPHIVLDNFLDEAILNQALTEFPNLESENWTQYLHFNEKKYGKNKLEGLPNTLKSIIEELNSPLFLNFLEKISGIHNLLADNRLEGGGLHQSPQGGFLNIHADFTVHPHQKNWQRRVNVLLYLNKDWHDSYGGHLELWDKSMTHCVKKIAPVFNRCVIFNTDQDSFHGHPLPLQCPEDITRKSIALYYFTEETTPFIRSTEYRARPEDNYKKSLLIYTDKIALRIYDKIKRHLKINDDFISKVLGFLFRKR